MSLHSPKGAICAAKEPMKCCLSLLVVTGMLIKITVGHRAFPQQHLLLKVGTPGVGKDTDRLEFSYIDGGR